MLHLSYWPQYLTQPIRHQENNKSNKSFVLNPNKKKRFQTKSKKGLPDSSFHSKFCWWSILDSCQLRFDLLLSPRSTIWNPLNHQIDCNTFIAGDYCFEIRFLLNKTLIKCVHSVIIKDIIKSLELYSVFL